MTNADYRSLASFSEAEIRPLTIGRRLWIGPTGTPAPEEGERLPVWLAAGPAFGSGAHPTTQLCLRVLDRRLPAGARVLDVGTGTGILAIAAARLGAREVVGTDIDPAAVEVARANVLHNGVSDRAQIEMATLADLTARKEKPFGWVIANILAHVLVELLGQGLAGLLEPGGWIVLSGFLRRQTPELRGALFAAHLELLAQEQQDEWTCIIARRPDGRLAVG
jgi:ribosomal protein L11 methyltransferase